MPDHTYPISELFGPTRQGEGPQAGLQCYFLRFAGCDWDCSWCDTKYAVLPKYPGWHKKMMTAEYIGQSLRAKGASRDDWITLSGGNPALFVDEALVDELVHTQGFRLAMETQGSVDLKDHVSQDIECLVVSPKPPSSGMHTRFKLETVIDLLYERMSSQVTAVKFVAFNAEDLDWCHLRHMEIVSEQHRLYKGMMVVEDVQWFLSVGTPLQIINDSPEDLDQIEAVRLEVCKNLSRTWLATLDDPFHRFRDFRILPQLHTLVWGQKAGV